MQEYCWHVSWYADFTHVSLRRRLFRIETHGIGLDHLVYKAALLKLEPSRFGYRVTIAISVDVQLLARCRYLRLKSTSDCSSTLFSFLIHRTSFCGLSLTHPLLHPHSRLVEFCLSNACTESRNLH